MSAVKSNSVQVLEHVEENPSYKQMSDTRLILACQRKEHQAFNVLIHRHQRYIQTLIYNLAPIGTVVGKTLFRMSSFEFGARWGLCAIPKLSRAG